MNRIYFVIFLQLLLVSRIHSQSFGPAHIHSIAQYIVDLQFTDSLQPSFGALKKLPGQDIIGGQLYYAVIPYFNHIGAWGLLNSDHPLKCQVVRRWIMWYFNHMDAHGQLLNYYYRSDGTGETTCPAGASGAFCNFIDSEDSDPALFWILLNEYRKKSAPPGFFTPVMKQKVEIAAQFVIDSLFKPDHLTIAKRNYAIKYTMDNSEVCAGFYALAELEELAFHDSIQSNAYTVIANNMRTAIQTLLYNNTLNLYDNHLGGTTDTSHWYALGVTATVWPQLFGIDDFATSRSIRQRTVLDRNFDGSPNPDWTAAGFMPTVDAFSWASIGYAFSRAQDTTRGYAQAQYLASSVFVSPFPYPPCFIADAGWLIQNMSTKFPSTNFCGTVGINPHSEPPSIVLSPNPTSGIVRLCAGLPFGDVRIVNVLGQVLWQREGVLESAVELDLQGWPSGVYFVRAAGKTLRLVKK